jgi:ABC-type lipoprotein export system ATPase subunit
MIAVMHPPAADRELVARRGGGRSSAIALSLRGVSDVVRRGRRTVARLDRVSADICECELTVMVGGEGRARSRLLEIAAGTAAPAAGMVLTGGSLHRGLGDPRASQLRTGEAVLIAGASREGGLRSLLQARPHAADPAAARRQSGAIAAALATDPLILFADLDPAGEAASIAAIAEWVGRRGRTALVAAGNPLAAAPADRVLVLGGDGRIVGDLEHPDHEELEELARAGGRDGG